LLEKWIPRFANPYIAEPVMGVPVPITLFPDYSRSDLRLLDYSRADQRLPTYGKTELKLPKLSKGNPMTLIYLTKRES
jgi:hypothetical protein